MFTSLASSRARIAILVATVAMCATATSGQTPRYFPDDPIAREPESQDASKAAPLRAVADV